MNAEIVSVGTELLLGQIVDTNAPYIARTLAAHGISAYHRTTVGDNPQRLTETLRQAFSRADIVITIGGIGPTMDDLTKETVSDVLGIPLEYDEKHRKWLENLAKSRDWTNIPPAFWKQAQIPSQGAGIANPNGTALGALFRTDDKLAICLPGPPNELIPMVEAGVVPILTERTTGRRETIYSRVLRIVGIGEPLVEEKIKDLMAVDTPSVAPYAKQGEVHLRITVRATDTAAGKGLIAPTEAEIRRRLGHFVYGADDETLESVVVRKLQERGMTVTAAESCSGGLIAKRITDIADASRVFNLGLVTYSNQAKQDLLHVPREELEQYGAVSPQVAKSMARGALQRAGADIAVSVTGIAGPGGGSPEKPVGTVHIGLAWDGRQISTHNHFLGSRSDIAHRSSQAALNLIRLLLVNPDDPIFTSNK